MDQPANQSSIPTIFQNGADSKLNSAPKKNKLWLIVVLCLVFVSLGLAVYLKVTKHLSNPLPSGSNTQNTSLPSHGDLASLSTFSSSTQVVQVTYPNTSNPAPAQQSASLLSLKMEIQSSDSGKIKGNLIVNNAAPSGRADLYYGINLNTPQTLTAKTLVNNQKVTSVTSETVSYIESNNFEIKGGEKKSFPFEIQYSSHLNPGLYTLQATLESKLGNFLALPATTQIKLTGKSDLITFNKDSCRVVINSKKYTPVIAPMVDPKGEAEGICDFTNNSSAKIDVVYALNYAVQHVFYYPKSEKLTANSNQSFSFNAGETKTLSFPLPTDLPPQVYEAAVSFNDLQNNQLSPFALFRWTIKGESSRIESVSLDKDYYLEGQKARVSTTVDPSMDLFWRTVKNGDPQAGTTLTHPSLLLSIFNTSKELCGQQTYSISTPFLIPQRFDLDINIQKDCFNPSVQVKVFDSDKQLADGTINVVSSKAAQPGTNQPKKVTNFLPFISGTGILILTILAVIFILKKGGPKPPRGIPPTLVLLVTFCLTVLILQSKSSVKAQTTSGTAISTPGPVGLYIGNKTVYSTFTGSKDSSNTITLSGYISGVWCDNYSGSVFIEGPGITGWTSVTSTALNGPWTYNPGSTSTASYNFVTFYDYFVPDGASESGFSSDGANSLGAQYGTLSLINACTSPDPSTVCSSTTYTDNYGNSCTGTKAPVCDGSATCIGSTATGSCGSTCAGTKICDTTPPTISWVNKPTATCFTPTSWSSSQPFSVYVTDPGISQGLANVTFNIPGVVSQTVYNPSNPSAVNSPALASPGNGNYTLSATVTDNTGKTASVSTSSFNIKSSCTAPFIQGNQGDVHSNTGINTQQ